MRRHVGGAGCGACRRASQARPRRRGHRPVPMRGPPLVAGHDRMKGSANAAWNGAVKPSGPVKKYGDRVKNRRGGAPEGARAGNAARGRLRKVPYVTLRRSGAPPPSRGNNKARAKARKQDKTDSPSAHVLRGDESVCPHALNGATI